MQKIAFKYILQHGVIIEEMGGEITGTMEAATFCQVLHLYMHNQMK